MWWLWGKLLSSSKNSVLRRSELENCQQPTLKAAEGIGTSVWRGNQAGSHRVHTSLQFRKVFKVISWPVADVIPGSFAQSLSDPIRVGESRKHMDRLSLGMTECAWGPEINTEAADQDQKQVNHGWALAAVVYILFITGSKVGQLKMFK